MSETIKIFGQDVTLETLKIHATGVNKGFLVTMVAELDDESVVWAATRAASVADMDGVTDTIKELSVDFRAWLVGVSGADEYVATPLVGPADV